MNRKPKSEDNQQEYRTWKPITDLEKEFSIWLNLLNQYKSINSFYDDSIVKAFSDEYFTYFEIIDEDAETAPFSTQQILALDEHLAYIEDNIDKYK